MAVFSQKLFCYPHQWGLVNISWIFRQVNLWIHYLRIHQRHTWRLSGISGAPGWMSVQLSSPCWIPGSWPALTEYQEPWWPWRQSNRRGESRAPSIRMHQIGKTSSRISVLVEFMNWDWVQARYNWNAEEMQMTHPLPAAQTSCTCFLIIKTGR